MTTIATLRLRELTTAESLALLVSQNVGRIAFGLHDRVDIEPINYISDGEWIFGRTSKGTKLATLLHHPWCAFEVDGVRGLFDWSSVVVKGTFYLLDPEIGSPDTYRRAEQLLHVLGRLQARRARWPRGNCGAQAVQHPESDHARRVLLLVSAASA